MSQNKLRLIPLGGGPGQVTKNMFIYEWGQDVLIVDCGIGFPADKQKDEILIPDITWLKQHQKKIHAIILTHGHDDHHAALPYILPQLGPVPVFGSRLTTAFASDRLRDRGVSRQLKLLKPNDQLPLGPFTVEPIYVTHSIPDTYHFAIHTPVGIIYHGSDFKFDLTPVDGRRPDFSKMVALGKKNIRCLLSDCLRSERAGFSTSESSLTDIIHQEISHCPGRFIFTTMSSNIHRIQQAINVAVDHGRKIAFVGRSMERNSQTASRLGFLRLPRQSMIKKHQLKKIPDHRLCLIVSGSQGQESSSLTRYAAGTNRFIKVKPTDKVVFSTDIIPGNEQAVYQVIDQLFRQGADVSYSQAIDDLHVSGHASAGELQLLMELTKAQYLYPIGGTDRHLYQYRQLALAMGYRQDQVIIPRPAQIVELTQDGKINLGKTLSLREIRVKHD